MRVKRNVQKILPILQVYGTTCHNTEKDGQVLVVETNVLHRDAQIGKVILDRILSHILNANSRTK